MHPKTKADLDKIDRIEKEIEHLKDKIKTVKLNCQCHDYRFTTEECFAYEYRPVKKCLVCHKPNRVLTKEESEQVLADFDIDEDSRQFYNIDVSSDGTILGWNID